MAIIPVFTTPIDLSTYEGLKGGVSAYLNRMDLVGNIPAFISQHEAKMNRELRVRDMLTRVQTSTNNEFVEFPTDFLGHYSLRLDSADGSQLPSMRPLDYIGDNEAAILRARNTQGPTRWYTVNDGVFELLPSPKGPVTLLMTYYAKIPTLGEPTGTPPAPRVSNWLLVKAPDLYVVGSCLEAQAFMKDDTRLNTWATIRGGIMENMNLESEKSKRSETYLVARKRGF